MEFVLTIEIEDGVTRRDMALALRRVAAVFEKYDADGTYEVGDSAPIYDLDGEHVGHWQVTPEEE